MPTGTPTTIQAVRLELFGDAADASEDARIIPKIAAVNAVVMGLPVAQGLPETGPWPDRIVQGATLLATRLYRRKNSPSGVELIGANGAVYVRRNDPDIAMLLQLGDDWSKPQVG